MRIWLFWYSGWELLHCSYFTCQQKKKPWELINGTAFSCTVLKHQKPSTFWIIGGTFVGELCLYSERSCNELPSPFTPVATAEQDLVTQRPCWAIRLILQHSRIFPCIRVHCFISKNLRSTVIVLTGNFSNRFFWKNWTKPRYWHQLLHFKIGVQFLDFSETNTSILNCLFYWDIMTEWIACQSV